MHFIWDSKHQLTHNAHIGVLLMCCLPLHFELSKVKYLSWCNWCCDHKQMQQLHIPLVALPTTLHTLDLMQARMDIHNSGGCSRAGHTCVSLQCCTEELMNNKHDVLDCPANRTAPAHAYSMYYSCQQLTLQVNFAALAHAWCLQRVPEGDSGVCGCLHV